MMNIIKNILLWLTGPISTITCVLIMSVIGILVWIDWKLNYKGFPIDACGIPHPHE
jgi:type IV secretory pathway VirB2 component (pilin)